MRINGEGVTNTSTTDASRRHRQTSRLVARSLLSEQQTDITYRLTANLYISLPHSVELSALGTLSPSVAGKNIFFSLQLHLVIVFYFVVCNKDVEILSFEL